MPATGNPGCSILSDRTTPDARFDRFPVKGCCVSVSGFIRSNLACNAFPVNLSDPRCPRNAFPVKLTPPGRLRNEYLFYVRPTVLTGRTRACQRF
jgi:hypothetical protein